MLTAQDENLVRKGERLVFCEHCSRIHYWQESEALEGTPRGAQNNVAGDRSVQSVKSLIILIPGR